MWKIPLFDANLKDGEREAVDSVIRSGWLTMGEITIDFEKQFADFLDVRHALAVSSCTAALHLANRALGVGPGDEVICPSLTFVAGANTILVTGARPVFAEIVSLDNFSILAADLERRITPRTKAVHVLHYAGNPCDMDAILEVTRRHRLKVIEDCAHAPGAMYNGKACGTIGDIGCFSFFSNKNMTTGEGGMLTTNDDGLAEKLRLMRSHGMTTMTLDRHLGRARSYDVVEEGFNYRFDEMRAAMGRVQLKKLPAANRRRRDLFRRYRKKLAGIEGISIPYPEDDKTCAHHIMPVLLPEHTDRDVFMDGMKEKGVQTSIHYPPGHLFSLYRERFGHKEGDLPVTEEATRRVITLPLYPGMSDDDVDYVSTGMEELLGS